MAKKEVFGRLHFSGKQSSADTDTFIKVPTGVSPSSGYGLRVESLRFSLKLFGVSSNSTIKGFSARLQMTRSEQTGLLDYSNSEVMAEAGLKHIADGANPVSLEFSTPIEMNDARGLLVVTPSIYLGFETIGSMGKAEVTGFIEYSTEKMTEVEILRILQG